MGGAPRVISITAPPARSAAAQGDLIGSKESVQQLQTDEAQIVNEIEEVQRVIKEEVRDDWMERWEERLRKKLDRHAKEGVRDGAWKCTKLEAGKARDEGKDEGGDSEDEDREGEWDWAGAGREQREGGGEDDEHEVWLHRGDDSDLLLPTDVFLISARKRSPSPPRSSLSLAQQGDSGSVVSPKQGWGSSVSRFIEGIGFISGTTTVPYQPLTTSAASTASGAVLSAPASLSPSPLPSGPGRITSPLLAQGEHKRMESSPQLDLGGPEGNPGLKCWMERRDAWTGADKEGRVRVGRSKFVENPLTASINEAAHLTIYNEFIKRALKPVIPINLKHITNALVAGLKMDDEWPPPTQAPEPAFSRRPVRGSGRSGTLAPPAAGDVRGAVPVGKILGML